VAAVWWRRLTALTFALVGCHALILVCGWIRLAALIGPAEAFGAGVAPFVAGAVAKSLVAAAATWTACRLRDRQAHGVASGGNSPG
jgi:biotin transporter BioY